MVVINSITICAETILLIVFWMTRYSFVGVYLFNMLSLDTLLSVDSGVTAMRTSVMSNSFFLVYCGCHLDGGVVVYTGRKGKL